MAIFTLHLQSSDECLCPLFSQEQEDGNVCHLRTFRQVYVIAAFSLGSRSQATSKSCLSKALGWGFKCSNLTFNIKEACLLDPSVQFGIKTFIK